MAKMKFPNPKFFRAKDNMDWKAQGKNLQEVGGIIWDMLKETDWKAFAAKQKDHAVDNINRVVREAKAIAAMTPAERLDLLKNGEKHLGTLYRKGDMATVRREWRGVADTAYDFKEWLRMWGMLLGTFSKDLVPALNMTFYYRWMMSYMCCVGFMDKNIMGQRGNALKMSHLLIYDIFRYVAENLVFLAKCDKKNGNSAELNKEVVLFDEMTMGQIMAGFPDLLGIPYQLLPVFHLRAVYRRGGILRPACRYLSRAFLRVRRSGHRRAAPYGHLLHLLLHALRRVHHGLVLYVPPVPRPAGVPSVLPRLV